MTKTSSVSEVVDSVRAVSECLGQQARKIGLDRVAAKACFNITSINRTLKNNYGGSYEPLLNNAVNEGLDKVFTGTEQPPQEREPEQTFENDSLDFG